MRNSVIRPVYFSGVSTGAYVAHSLDVSTGGFCVLTDLDMVPGQMVRIFSSTLWPEPMEAVAVWKISDPVDGTRVGFRLSQTDRHC